MILVIVEAFAVVREAAKRTLGMRHFDVQVFFHFFVCLSLSLHSSNHSHLTLRPHC